MKPLELRAGTSGIVASRIDLFGGTHAVFVEVGTDANDDRALGLSEGVKLAHAAEAAIENQLPLVCLMTSTGPRTGDGIEASHGWGLAARSLVRASGLVPILLGVTGPTVSGMALLLGLADLVVMTEDAYAFVTGPHVVRQVTGVPVSTSELGGARTHARSSGVASIVVTDRDEAIGALEELLALLPPHCDALPRRWPATDPPDRAVPEAGEILPDSVSAPYDARDLAAIIVDDGELIELNPEWSPNLVTALALIDGRTVGIVANQPMSIAGTLDIPASQKGARFVGFCDAFNIPLVTFVDTSGFYPGKDLEWRGMIRHGAQLAFAYARATVPRIAVTVRKSYGGAYIVMDSKHVGNDLMLAWPTAEIAVMGAKGAVEILHRRATSEERRAGERDYEERLLNPYIAAARGSVDAVIEPGSTRQLLAEALATLEAKREKLAPRAHDNIPL